MYCKDEHRQYAHQDQKRDWIREKRRSQDYVTRKDDCIGSKGLGAKKEEEELSELKAVHKELMIAKGTYTKARFELEIMELTEKLYA